jgi:outer membrane protein
MDRVSRTSRGKRYFSPLILFAALASASASAIAAPVKMVTLADALRLGAAHEQVLSERSSAQAADERAKALHRQASWPTIGVGGYVERTDQLAGFDTPFGTLTSGDKTRGQLYANVRIPLLNESLSLRSDAEELQAAAGTLQAARTADQRALVAAQRYLDVLILQARLAAEQSLHASLASRLDRADALQKIGRVLKADVLKVRLELAQVDQAIARLNGQLHVARMGLAAAIGSDDEVDAAPLAWVPERLPDDASNDDFKRRRQDILALRKRIDGLAKSAEAINAEERRLRIDIVAQHNERHGVSLLPGHENTIGIQFSLPLFNAGTVDPGRAAALYERTALEKKLIDGEREANLDVAREKEAFDIAVNLKALADTAIESARQTVDMRRSLYELGRVNVDDLLASESELERQRMLSATADIERARAWLGIQYARGINMRELKLN